MSISKNFIPNFVRVLTNKRKYIEHNFYSVARAMHLGRDLGCWGVKNVSVGICDGAQSTAHSSIGIASSLLDLVVIKGHPFSLLNLIVILA